jgi:hypothetical protein
LGFVSTTTVRSERAASAICCIGDAVNFGLGFGFVSMCVPFRSLLRFPCQVTGY